MSSVQDDEEAAEKAAFLTHAIRYGFPPGSLSPSATKLKRAMPSQIAKLNAISSCYTWLQAQKELLKTHPEKSDKANLTMLGAFCMYVSKRTGHYMDLVVSEDGWRTNILTQWVISQKSGRSMTVKKPGLLARMRGKKDEAQYVPEPEV